MSIQNSFAVATVLAILVIGEAIRFVLPQYPFATFGIYSVAFGYSVFRLALSVMQQRATKEREIVKESRRQKSTSVAGIDRES